ncbi:MAG: ParA family protein, partial [Solirubrobacterales bacterium]
MEEAVPERPSEDDFAPAYSDSYEQETYSDDYEDSDGYAEAAPEAAPEPVAEFAPEPEMEAEPAAAPPPEPAAAIEVEEDDESENDGRIKAVDLIAPTRLDFIAEQRQEAEVPVKAAQVYAFANQKGGVAKTTTTLNLAVAFAESGYRVLCVDLDPQGNLTMSQGI